MPPKTFKTHNAKRYFKPKPHILIFYSFVDSVMIHSNKQTTKDVIKGVKLLIEAYLCKKGMCDTNDTQKKLIDQFVYEDDQQCFMCNLDRKAKLKLISLDTENKTGTIQVIKPSYLKYPDKYPNPDIRDFSYTQLVTF